MMHWYETHTEEFRQATFVDGQPVAGEPDDAPPEPEGPFSVAEETVDDYLDTLRRSGFFSLRYVAALHARATATARALERQQPPKDQMPGIEEVPLFARNYDDLMSQKDDFKFTIDRGGRVVSFNDGYTLMQFCFNKVCEIDSISSKRYVHVNDPVE